jgi:hypothetical protein
VTERVRLCIDPDRAAPGEDERDGADELGREPTGGICYRAAPAQLV